MLYDDSLQFVNEWVWSKVRTDRQTDRQTKWLLLPSSACALRVMKY